jgi:hypothetical protein
VSLTVALGSGVSLAVELGVGEAGMVVGSLVELGKGVEVATGPQVGAGGQEGTHNRSPA